jgi:hypothetical protein
LSESVHGSRHWDPEMRRVAEDWSAWAPGPDVPKGVVLSAAAALARYGTHRPNCDVHDEWLTHPPENKGMPCSCGWDSLRAHLKRAGL